MGGGGGKKSSSSNSNNQSSWQNDQAEAMRRQMEAAKKAAEAERKRLEAERKEQERQQAIRAENQKAADFRRSAENKIQSNFQSMAENQQRLDQQAAPQGVSGSGYNIETAQQQKISAAGGVAGPAATNAPGAGQMGVPQAMALNAGTGGTKQSSNFSLPIATGLQFGGM
jgi:hypothetical protein